MGEIVLLPDDATTDGLRGYLARPDTPNGRAVVVIQEWWGLVPHIEDVCDRFAAEGFAAIAPDLYHGDTTVEPDEAGKLMMALTAAEAAREIDVAADHLLGLDEVTASTVNVIGFCMGGGLAIVYSCLAGDKVAAVTPFYGLIPWPDAAPDYTALRARLRGHYAERDEYFSPELAVQLESALVDAGRDARITVHAGCDHAFFNDARPEVYNAEASAVAWAAVLETFNA